jgi:hypothetical protein
MGKNRNPGQQFWVKYGMGKSGSEIKNKKIKNKNARVA